MSDSDLPIYLNVTRDGGGSERLRVGTAHRQGDGYTLSLQLTIGGGGGAPAWSAPPGGDSSRRPPASSPAAGLVFPPYGRSKGAPIAGASEQDLEYYAAGCRRTLADPAKSRWHDKERALLAAIEAEIARQRGGLPPMAAEVGSDGDAPPPPTDDDIPF